MARKRRRLAVVTFVVVALGAVAALGLFVAWRNDAQPADAAASTITATDPPKTIPPSSTAPAEATATDPEAEATTAAPQPTQSGPREVAVVLTYAGYLPESGGVVAGGYADAVTEDDGTCTLTLTRGGVTRQATGAGLADAASTSCSELKVPQNQLSSGEWQATISYRSPRAAGTSKAFPVDVP